MHHDAFQGSTARQSTAPGTAHRHRCLQHCKCPSPSSWQVPRHVPCRLPCFVIYESFSFPGSPSPASENLGLPISDNNRMGEEEKETVREPGRTISVSELVSRSFLKAVLPLWRGTFSAPACLSDAGLRASGRNVAPTHSPRRFCLKVALPLGSGRICNRSSSSARCAARSTTAHAPPRMQGRLGIIRSSATSRRRDTVPPTSTAPLPLLSFTETGQRVPPRRHLGGGDRSLATWALRDGAPAASAAASSSPLPLPLVLFSAARRRGAGEGGRAS